MIARTVLRGAAGQPDRAADGYLLELHSPEAHSLPSGLKKIGNAAFYGSGLEKITIPASVTEIDDWAFAWITNMKTIDIPDTVESVGFNAYIYAKGVKDHQHRLRCEDHWQGWLPYPGTWSWAKLL